MKSFFFDGVIGVILSPAEDRAYYEFGLLCNALMIEGDESDFVLILRFPRWELG